jgi:hypothetical protein
MSKFITIKTFNHPNDLLVIRSKLESEGVVCFAQDEQITQIHPFYSGAVGGVKLQVREEDVNRAVEIMKEAGHIQDRDLKPSKLDIRLYKILSKIPFVRNIYK